MTTPNSFENTPIDAKDGTLRYFLSLPDGSDNETPIEELSNRVIGKCRILDGIKFWTEFWQLQVAVNW